MLWFLVLAFQKIKIKTKQLLELSRCGDAQISPCIQSMRTGTCSALLLAMWKSQGVPRCDKDRLEAGLCPPVPITACSPVRFLSGFPLSWALFFPGAQILSGGRVLSLPTPRLLDSGTYTCVASSAVGEDRREATVEVRCKCPQVSPAPSGGCSLPSPQPGGCGASPGKRILGVALPCLFPVPPSALGEEENVSAIVNQEVTLRCPAPGVDPRGSRWLKDGTLLTPSPGMWLSEDGTALKVMYWSKIRDGRGKKGAAEHLTVSPCGRWGEPPCRMRAGTRARCPATRRDTTTWTCRVRAATAETAHQENTGRIEM